MRTIQAIFENGVFRPIGIVDLPERAVVEFEPRLQTNGASPAAGSEPTLQGLLRFAGVASDLPSDMAAQHDHYIHGTPKR